eukprot:3823663-Pyramimonas_sp.AAC.1
MPKSSTRYRKPSTRVKMARNTVGYSKRKRHNPLQQPQVVTLSLNVGSANWEPAVNRQPGLFCVFCEGRFELPWEQA